MEERKKSIQIERKWFIDSYQGNIKDDYYFEKKLGSGGYGAVYLAKNKKTGNFNSLILSLITMKKHGKS